MPFQVATYKPSDALLEAKVFIKSMPLDTSDGGNLQYLMVDEIASLVWLAAPWWWTVGVMSNITLNAGTQDYAITVPTDFLYLARAVATYDSIQTELETVSVLPSSITQIGTPTQCAVMAVSVSTTPDTFRLSPTPPTSYSAVANLTYKRQPPKITVANFGTVGALVLPDCYFPVISAGVLWRAYQYADDNRAGTCTCDGQGKLEYTQQLGIFQGMLAEMRRNEKTFLKYPGAPSNHG